MADVTILGAGAAGLLSFASPCMLPMVPPYLCFLAGVTLDELTGEEEIKRPRARILATAFAFVLGFSTVFVMLGASASMFGQFMRFLLAFDISLFGLQIAVLPVVSGLIIIAMGLHFLGIFELRLLYRQARMEVKRQPAGPLGAYLVGLAFAIGWTPCIGPVLGTILIVAGSESSAFQGAGLLAAYSLGMGVPFIAAGLFAGPFMRLMARFRPQMRNIERAMGALLVTTGILFLTGQMTALSAWLQAEFPSFWQLG